VDEKGLRKHRILFSSIRLYCPFRRRRHQDEAGACTAVILPLLLSTKGIGSDAAEVRALSIDTIAKICKTADHDQIQVSFSTAWKKQTIAFVLQL
jgi:hypothetical protein